MLVGHQPMVAVGPGTYLDDLLTMARRDQYRRPAPRRTWPHLSIEYIIAMRPEVILDGQMGNGPGFAVRLSGRDIRPSRPSAITA